MLSGAEIALAAAALLIGFTGTWSPCGFSMIETIGPVGHTGGRRTTLAACATFFPGTLIGGVATFAALAWLGGVVFGAAGPVAYGIAAAIALGAAALEAKGTPIVPQIRRQLPEHWRRVMPMPLAAGLYGVLLGLGFTTFVLSFGVWALAGISVAVGDVWTGVIIGLAFGIGRGVPIVVLAPLSDRPSGARITEMMAVRRSLYRGARLGDAVALMVVAAVLGASGAEAARNEAAPAADPGVKGSDLVYQDADRAGVLRRLGTETPLTGTDPAIGGGFIATLGGKGILLLDSETLDEIGQVAAGSADAVAVSRKWLVYRTRRDGKDRMLVRKLSPAGEAGKPTRIAKAKSPSQLGLPSVSGGRLVYTKATGSADKLIYTRIADSKSKVLRKTRFAALTNPAVNGRRLVYIETTSTHQNLRIRGIKGSRPGKVLTSRRSKTSPFWWSTALGKQRAYVTVSRAGGDHKVISVPRG